MIDFDKKYFRRDIGFGPITVGVTPKQGFHSTALFQMRGDVYSREETMSTLDKNHLGKATLEANLSPFSSFEGRRSPVGEVVGEYISLLLKQIGAPYHPAFSHPLLPRRRGSHSEKTIRKERKERKERERRERNHRTTEETEATKK